MQAKIRSIRDLYLEKSFGVNKNRIQDDTLNALGEDKSAEILITSHRSISTALMAHMDDLQFRREVLSLHHNRLALEQLSVSLERAMRADLALISNLKSHTYKGTPIRSAIRSGELFFKNNLFSLGIYFLSECFIKLDFNMDVLRPLADGLLLFGDTENALYIYENMIDTQHVDKSQFGKLAEAAFKAQLHTSAIFWSNMALKHGGTKSYFKQVANISRAQICDWSNAKKDEAFIKDILANGTALSLHSAMSMVDDPNLAFGAAKKLKKSSSVKRSQSVMPLNSNGHSVTKIAYFGADFHNHATMYLLSGLLRNHDRTRFKISIYSYGPDVQDEMRFLAVQNCDGFYEVSRWSDSEIADHARNKGIDVAIDLKGATKDTRLGIFNERIARTQISYLGYPGTSGSESMDFIVADKILIPEGFEKFYSERIIFMPNSYQPNDNKRPISSIDFKRGDFQIPDDAFVLCCFNANWKIRPVEFSLWLEVLKEKSNVVLWLYRSSSTAEENLRKEAALRGVAPNRLIFSDHLPHSEHLSRLGLVDLFVDTFNCNAHTTASDALWAGVPVITKTGKQFSARVCSSLLNAMDLDEMVTDSDEQYKNKILELIHDPDALQRIRDKVQKNRYVSPLFDPELYARHFEARVAQALSASRLGFKPLKNIEG
jgi:predicted O-linked N-acetylglucosamine transferase (SPINDLY family)